MSVFTPGEQAYLVSQRLGRLATRGTNGELHVVPAGFRYNADEDALEIGGWNFGHSKKYRDALRTGQVAFVVDDSGGPRHPRGVEVRGRAEPHRRGGEEIVPGWDPEFIRLRPAYIASWGIDADPFHPTGRRVP